MISYFRQLTDELHAEVPDVDGLWVVLEEYAVWRGPNGLPWMSTDRGLAEALADGLRRGDRFARVLVRDAPFYHALLDEQLAWTSRVLKSATALRVWDKNRGRALTLPLRCMPRDGREDSGRPAGLSGRRPEGDVLTPQPTRGLRSGGPGRTAGRLDPAAVGHRPLPPDPLPGAARPFPDAPWLEVPVFVKVDDAAARRP